MGNREYNLKQWIGKKLKECEERIKRRDKVIAILRKRNALMQALINTHVFSDEFHDEGLFAEEAEAIAQLEGEDDGMDGK